MKKCYIEWSALNVYFMNPSQHRQSWSSQSHLFLGSYANMHVYENNVLIQENLIKICVGDF